MVFQENGEVMKTADYIKLANISNRVLSWLCIFGFIGAYIRFMGFNFAILAICFLVYLLACCLSIYLRRETLKKPQMSYVIHPLYFGAVILGFFITTIESRGTDLNAFLIYVVFLIACYMVNCYISAFTVKISSATASKAATMIKYSVKQNIMFAIWLASFVLAGVLVIFIPASGLGAVLLSVLKRLFSNLDSGDNNGSIDDTYVEDETEKNLFGAEAYEDNVLLAIILMILIITLVILIIYLARKVFYRNDKVEKYSPEVNYDIIEEVSDIKKNSKQRKEKEVVSDSAEAKIRHSFSKTVNSYHESINSAKTPSELLKKGFEGENELTELYEKVRYSDLSADDSEVKRAKELSTGLIKRAGKKKG